MTTGFFNWPAARGFAAWPAGHGLVAGRRVLELGSGSGWLAKELAARGPAALTLTDLPVALPGLVQAVAGLDVAVAALDWDNLDASAAKALGPPEVVIGTDLCWGEETVASLAIALAAFRGAGSQVVYAHWHRGDGAAAALTRAVAARGCALRVVHGDILREYGPRRPLAVGPRRVDHGGVARSPRVRRLRSRRTQLREGGARRRMRLRSDNIITYM